MYMKIMPQEKPPDEASCKKDYIPYRICPKNSIFNIRTQQNTESNA